jgi:transposase-like protein
VAWRPSSVEDRLRCHLAGVPHPETESQRVKISRSVFRVVTIDQTPQRHGRHSHQPFPADANPSDYHAYYGLWRASRIPDNRPYKVHSGNGGWRMPERRRRFSPEFKDEAVKMVLETSRPIAEVARELGVNEGTLGNWCKLYRETHASEEPALNITARAKLRELKKEVRDLRLQNEFLKKAAAYFAKEGR